MTTITELAEKMQTLLTVTAEAVAKATGFIERQRKVSGAGFAQAVVFSLMANGNAPREEVNQAAASGGMQVSTPGLDKRFNAKGALFLERLLGEAVQELVEVVPQQAHLLTRFNGVYVGDSTLVGLPTALASVFAGTDGEGAAAAKVAVQWELKGGGLNLWVSAGRVHDQQTEIGAQTLPVNALRLNDLGFFNLTTFENDSREGIYFLSRYKVGTLVFNASGEPLRLEDYLPHHGREPLELAIQLGAKRLPCRLMAFPISPEQLGKRRKHLREIARRKQQPLSHRAFVLAGWTLYLTNIPPDLLALAEAPILGCTRWQIECLFKLWKSQGCLDSSRSLNPQRICCEFYAKLLALLIQHWLILVGCWQRLDRSLHRAAQVIRKFAFALLATLTDLSPLVLTLHHLALVLATTTGMSKRAKHPLTFQRWLDEVEALNL